MLINVLKALEFIEQEIEVDCHATFCMGPGRNSLRVQVNVYPASPDKGRKVISLCKEFSLKQLTLSLAPWQVLLTPFCEEFNHFYKTRD